MAGPYAAGVCLGHRLLPPGRPGSALERWESILEFVCRDCRDIWVWGLGFRVCSPFQGIIGTYGVF